MMDAWGAGLVLLAVIAMVLTYFKQKRPALWLIALVVVMASFVAVFDLKPPPKGAKVDLQSFEYAKTLVRRAWAGLAVILVGQPFGRVFLGGKGSRYIGLAVLSPYGLALSLSSLWVLGILKTLIRAQASPEVAIAGLTRAVERADMFIVGMTVLSCLLLLLLAALDLFMDGGLFDSEERR